MTGIISAATTRKALVKVLAQGQQRACQTNEPVLASLSLPLPNNNNPVAVFSACKSASFRTFWGKPSKAFWLVGYGSAVKLISNGETSIDGVTDKYRTLLTRAVIEAPCASGVGPVALGGFRYDTQAIRDAVWRSFPDAMLVLPRFLFTRSGTGAWLTINSMVGTHTDVAVQAESLLAELQALDITRLPEDRQPIIKRVSQSSSEEYASYVRKALEDIQGGFLTKVVLARRKVLCAEAPFSLDSALEQLCDNYPDCVIFAFENGGSAFFGATPESLVSINQGRLSLTCLAGSSSRGNSPEEDLLLEKQLYESPKERAEHAAVVATVTESLKDLCRKQQWDSEPRILKLRNVQHLLTSVSGILNPCTSVIDIVKRLHPTPAVAGVPTDRAVSFIRDNEGDRGWYAAPVGWLDHAGGGEFAVGIRSGLLVGKRAVLYAGAGIVKGSEPEREFKETELKFQPLMSALGGSQ